jgi:SAM-dependent methyltransferase
LSKTAKNREKFMTEKSKLKDRVERERKWHDDRFSDDDTRSGGGRFYLALKDWYGGYDSFCFSHKCKKALEVGAGLETVSLENKISFSLTSIDISSKAIDVLKAKEIGLNIFFEVADAHELPYADGEFDFVFARGVLHHLDLEVGISEIKRVLSANGKVLFGEPLAGNPLIQLYRYMTPNMRTPDERPLSSKDIRFVRDSFEGVTVTYFGFVTIIAAIITNKHNKLAAKLDNFILNRLQLGPYLAWACLIENIES